jgi:hypothetical protein
MQSNYATTSTVAPDDATPLLFVCCCINCSRLSPLPRAVDRAVTLAVADDTIAPPITRRHTRTKHKYTMT